MAEIEEELKFETARGNISLKTEMNGDQITVRGLHFTKEQAASFAWMLNNTDIASLEITIKEKT